MGYILVQGHRQHLVFSICNQCVSPSWRVTFCIDYILVLHPSGQARPVKIAPSDFVICYATKETDERQRRPKQLALRIPSQFK